MENLKRHLENVKELDLQITSTGNIKQTERNQLKADTLEALGLDLAELGVLIGKTKEGLVLELSNDSEGAFPVVLDVKFKNVNFDTQLAVDSYNQDQEQKRLDKEQRQRDKQASYKNQMKRKEMNKEKA